MSFPKDLLSKSKQRLEPKPAPTVQDFIGVRVPEITEAQKGGIMALAGEGIQHAEAAEHHHAAQVERAEAERKRDDEEWERILQQRRAFTRWQR